MPRHRKTGYIFGILGNLLFLWILEMVPGWNLDWLINGYMIILTILQINCLLHIAGNIVMLIFDSIFIRHLVKIIFDTVAIVILVLIYYLYPVDFTLTEHVKWLNNVFPFIIIISIVITGIGVISNFFKLFVKEDELM
jgi:hypothetical protein